MKITLRWNYSSDTHDTVYYLMIINIVQDSFANLDKQVIFLQLGIKPKK